MPEKNYTVRKDWASAKISTYLENGRVEITTKDKLEEYPPGSLISFIKKGNVLKVGGFLTKITDDYFTYITPDFQNKFRVKFSNVVKMWVGDVYSTTNDIVSLVKAPKKKKTNFPVKVQNITVYYAKNNYDAKRFKGTEKYKIMLSWCEYFHPN